MLYRMEPRRTTGINMDVSDYVRTEALVQVQDQRAANGSALPEAGNGWPA